MRQKQGPFDEIGIDVYGLGQLRYLALRSKVVPG